MNLKPYQPNYASIALVVLLSSSTTAVSSQILSGYLNEDGEIVVISLYTNQGIGLHSSTDNLVPLPPGDLSADPDPYTFLLDNGSRQVIWGTLGTEVHLEGSFNTGVKLSDGDVSSVSGWYGGLDPIQFRIYDTQPPEVTATFDVGGRLTIHGEALDLTQVAIESQTEQEDRFRRFRVNWFNDLEGLDGSLSLPFESDVFPVSEGFDLVAVYCLEDGNCREIEFVTEFECDPHTFGDVNGDGSVGFADFLIMSFNFGKEVPDQSYGDVDCDGRVAFSDFLVTSSCFGCTTVGAEAVPEPNGLTLLLAAFVAMCMSSLRSRAAASGRS